MVAKPWGQETLPPPFALKPDERIGEVWFEPPAALDRLLVKYIFTSEALSVQVHPSDAQAEALGLGRQGKDECWLVIDAEPGARLGLGFAAPIDAAAIAAAALDGSIAALLDWFPVRAGDFFYVPAGTVHAIGAGISLIEVQQNSDITYRLFDYGRPRELHLDAGVAVARGHAHPPDLRQRLAAEGPARLVEGPLFRLDRLAGAPDADVRARYGEGPLLVIPLRGSAKIGDQVIAAGECGLAPALADISVPESALVLVAQPLDQPGRA